MDIVDNVGQLLNMQILHAEVANEVSKEYTKSKWNVILSGNEISIQCSDLKGLSLAILGNFASFSELWALNVKLAEEESCICKITATVTTENNGNSRFLYKNWICECCSQG